jgi:Outer membrane protein beta-barrel family/CarboxypepD_reg-like domain/TonB-dependent Receptor Plug Domain
MKIISSSPKRYPHVSLTLRCFLFFSFTYLQAFRVDAQVKLQGQVLDTSKKGASFVSVMLLNPKDSTMVKGNVSDVDGYYMLSDVPVNKTYLLSVLAVGFKRSYQTLEVGNKEINIPTIMLETELKKLNEVQVVAKKPLIERSGDKMIMNVEASPVTAGLNGLELLEKVPGVTVNRNTETIKLKGKSGILVMIDDRPTYLSEEQLATYLKSLKSDEIEKIEVITNPSARYDASGSTGIINIKTKKGKNFGTNYILDVGLGYSSYNDYGNYPKNSQGLTVNSRREKSALFFNISRNETNWFNSEQENQKLFSATNELLETRNNNGLTKGNAINNSAKLGYDYDFNKKTSAGVSFQIANSSNKLDREVIQQNTQNDLFQKIVFDRYRKDNNNTYTFNLHGKKNIDSSGTTLNADLSAIFNKATSASDFLTNTLANGVNTTVNNQIAASNVSYTYVGKLDYTWVLNKKTKIEMGAKSSYAKNDRDFNDNFRDNGALVNSFFRFYENINAAYIMVNRELKPKLNLQIGLRSEQTNTLGEDRLGNQISKQNYINLFPTLSLNQKVTKDYAISLGYSRRINRPWGDNFNTFKRFFFPLQYGEGNPTILPMLFNSFSLSHTYKDAFNLSFSYVTVQQFIADVYDLDTDYIKGKRLIRQSSENVTGNVSWWSADASLPFNITKWWNVNINIWSGINVYNYRRENSVVDMKQPYGGIYLQQTFTLGKTTTAELSGWANSGETWGFQTSKAQGAFDLGLKQFIWNKKGTLKLTLEDPMNLNRWQNSIATAQLIGDGSYRWDNRRIRINFTYNFGNTNVKVTQRPSNDGEGGSGKGGGRN